MIVLVAVVTASLSAASLRKLLFSSKQCAASPIGEEGGGKLNGPVGAAFGHHVGYQELPLVDLVEGSRDMKALRKRDGRVHHQRLGS